MNERPYPIQKKQMPLTAAEHRRQSLWQIWVPLGVAVLLFIALAVWASVATARSSVTGSHFADISTIFLIVPAAIIGLAILIIFSAIIFGLSRLLQGLPILSLRVRAMVYRVETILLTIVDKAAQPFLAIDSAWSGFNNFTAHFRKDKGDHSTVQ